MTISVVMGVYNPRSKKRLLNAVESIIKQTFKDWELILYDDGSDEKYRSDICEAADLDSRILLITGEKNYGLAYALNVGIQHASGKYIARMDDDDTAFPERFSKQAAFLDAFPDYGWVGSNALLEDSSGIWGVQIMPVCPDNMDFLPHSPYIHPSVLFRREVLIQNGGYCAEPSCLLCEDYELFMRLHQKGYRGYNLQDPLLRYWEDRNSYHKRTYSRRLREAKIRKQGFQKLGIPCAQAFPYVVKPLLLCLVPSRVYCLLRRWTKKGKGRERKG